MIQVHSRYANNSYNPPLELDIVEQVEMNPGQTLAQIVKGIPARYERSDGVVLLLQRIIIEELGDLIKITGA